MSKSFLALGVLAITLSIVVSIALKLLKSADPETSYFQVLIREIDNPSGNLLDGSPCNPFGFVGMGCNTYLTGGVAVGSDLTNTFENTQINSHGESKISNLNLILKDVNAAKVSEFTLTI
ncbi:hypothetical protein B9Z55_015449 [Caenorhabditis nigoni]|uniref:Uncharacterized protein n=1 Tax=Caenorhabditis nigoni TaxID=1611254 RepID=A0A2G5UA97_9PELO|nr:hypothetical protein B9Z55_015449 [Caenorhabditis nigoni]